ncbi:kinase-like domain-containing protein [Gilbertella persicaria]|uniref:kinase-like domain-containing protein n=1 Tax=Gilbertella persicaria TaxID=101096 RepID=UPI00221F40C1|nr:kinase-like domain-containing protein [Gilbertella persicaria]KAI8090997.1 kinase-like domain-containing protein [Gilbertella persicaria]
MKSPQEQHKQVVWSLENVSQWLVSNGWSCLVDTFTDYNIQHDRFLNLNMENLQELLSHDTFAAIDKQQLLSAIQQLKAEQKPSKPRIAIPAYPTHHLKPTHRFDITQFIPKRTSSNESNVSKLLASFQPTMMMMQNNRTAPKNPRINATNPEILSKLFGKRLPVPNRERRIQVTLDADTFIRLWIDPTHVIDIKRAILHKLNIEAELNYFLFFHENGPQSTIPLTDEELMYVCETSDNNQTNRVLVVPVEGYRLICQPIYHQHNSQTRYVLIQTSPTPSPISSSSVTGIQLTDPETPQDHDLIDLDPSHHASRRPSLWNIPASLYPPSIECAFEGVSLYDPPTPIHDQPSHDFIQQTTLVVESPPSPTDSERPSEAIVGERPSFERLYQDIDKYLPQHDVDKEIIQQKQPSRRLLGHRPSVRIVANEAHRRWKHLPKSICRRKSTKMWDRLIERVKPGEENRIELPTLAQPAKMQWMRGDLIGHGSFSRVYHALNLATLEWMAVKQVDAVITQADQHNQDLKAASDALYREIQLLKDLDHENIVQYIAYDYNPDEGHIYIFLEYVPGGSISSLLDKYGSLNECLIGFFTRQILQGLAYLHEKGILHRDIKGGNVLIDHDGVCKITDFGLSKSQHESDSTHSHMKGTLYWMAPEVLEHHYSPKVDIWSLGCTVLEMITGEHPWMELTTLAALYQIGLHNAPAIPTNISDQAKDFLQQCLQM